MGDSFALERNAETMYVPRSFQFDGQAEKVAFMRRYPFATIITAADGIPMATHLPFVLAENGVTITLSSHFAAANSQAMHIEGNTSLIIFSEPHAYISPSHYDKRESVPTWDYIAVHAYGTCRMADGVDAKLALLEKMIAVYEPEYRNQWDALPLQFKTGMLHGIVAFTLEVTDLQGQQKLSQNKTAAERTRIVQQLEASPSGIERDLATYIKKSLA
ncbi:negative transcriptional regulator, PaiB family [Parapedobacter koreensis]|uniref:Negative transcriptional regulator, PaiB family n=1 Tax=Parapedobacter koreensis TaxID=332977 RepID=A0A1H7TGL1_9SPHI|nr:negative transcriptional regulator, PaiB family [Parapedobacter koreensis]